MGDGKALAHSYRALLDWNKWLSRHYLGREVLETEKKIICDLLKNHYGKQALLVGVPFLADLLSSTDILHRTLLTPFHPHDTSFMAIESDFSDLPILTGAADLVILPHTLEFVDNPRQLLAEACRMVKPEGLIVVCSFNPYSAWGLKKLITSKTDVMPKFHQLISPGQIKNWLQLAEFTTENHRAALFRPPCKREKLFGNIQFIERIGAVFFPYAGGINIIAARAKVIPLTPIKMKWKQKLGHIGITKTIPGNIATQTPASPDRKP